MTACRESLLVPGEKGVFARRALRRGECCEWGMATVIPDYDVRNGDHLFTWSSTDRSVAAALSGHALFYNTLGDKSNCRCVPYHAERRFEIYALEDIAEGTELTFRYDSMNWRSGMEGVRSVVGELQGKHNQVAPVEAGGEGD